MKRKIGQQTIEWHSKRHARMLETGSGADVFFLVGKPGEKKQLISAHKYMLSAVSEVFEGQFLRFDKATGTQEGTEEEPILVPDVGPDAFNAMLRFIYALDLEGVTKQNVLEVYYAGDKYMLNALVQECRQWLMNDQHLGVDSVLLVLKHAQHHEDKILIEYCWKFVARKAKSVVDSEDFPLLKEPDLRELLSRNIQGIKEVKAHLLSTGKYAYLRDLFNIFENLTFVLISTSERGGGAKAFFNRSGCRANIEARDGQVVADFVQSDNIFLVADTFYRTNKYLCALSLSIPCVNYTWVRECMAQGKLLDHTPFLLPAGKSTLEPRRVFPWKPLKGHLFKGVRVIVYSKYVANKQHPSFDAVWIPLMRNLGATIVGSDPCEPLSSKGQRKATLEQKLEFCAKNKFDVLLTEKACEKELANCAQAKGAVAVSSEWIIQAMVTGELPDVNASEKFRYDFVWSIPEVPGILMI